LLVALEEHLDPPEIIVIRGPAAAVAQWREHLSKTYAPRRQVFAIPADAAALPPALAQKQPLETTVAYICRGMTCSEPVRSLAALVALTGR
jgi:uncharacterized protein YyaL (SSP411 family)